MDNKKKLLLTIFAGVVAFICAFFLQQEGFARVLVSFIAGLLAVSMFGEMIHTLRSGKYGVDLLAILAIISTLIVGEFWASLIIVLMLTGGETLEDYATKRAGQELQELLKKAPQIAHRYNGKKTEDVPIEEVEVGDTLLVRAHEVFAVDGVLSAGATEVDESSLTGESRPVGKKVGDMVLSGSMNGYSAVVMRATVRMEDSHFQKIVQLVKEAQSTPPEFVRLADRYAVPFTAIALIIAGLAWLFSGEAVRFAQVLVVASPCPLILAAPIAFVGGMSRSSRHGLLVKNGLTIERLNELKTIAFDKTGTLTKGILKIDRIETVGNISQKDLIQLVASLEKNSSHILGKAVLSYAEESNIPLVAIEYNEEIAGRGLIGRINGQMYKVGRASFANATSLDKTAIYVSCEEVYIGNITFIDEVRKESYEVLRSLRELGVENIIMLTGDNRRVAQKVAEELAIKEVLSSLMPEDKLNYVKDLSDEKRPVMMIGDGINDAPALAISDVGVALGVEGSNTVASETADVVLLRNNLCGVSDAVKIGKQTIQIAKEAVILGIIVCTVLMFIAATGVIPTVIGALCQEIVDVVAILWALRALKDR